MSLSSAGNLQVWVNAGLIRPGTILAGPAAIAGAVAMFGGGGPPGPDGPNGTGDSSYGYGRNKAGRNVAGKISAACHATQGVGRQG